MSNIIKIKHGGSAPTTSDLDNFELGWDKTNKKLYINSENEIVQVGGKRTCRFVIGTTTNGWTSADCDYLCDGNADDVEINQAIRDLPSEGGTIVLLDGTYNINSPISGNLANKKCIFVGGVTTIETASTFEETNMFYFYLNSEVKIYNMNLRSTLSNVRGVNSYGHLELYYCTIDTKGVCIDHIYDDLVIVSNCNLYCSTTDPSDVGTRINIMATSGCRIYNNIIKGYMGIYLYQCSNSSIYNNQIDLLSGTSTNNKYSIYLQDSSNNLIHNNKLWNKYFEDSTSSSNNFSGNVYPDG